MSYLQTSGVALQSMGMLSLMPSSASPPPQAASIKMAQKMSACFMAAEYACRTCTS